MSMESQSVELFFCYFFTKRAAQVVCEEEIRTEISTIYVVSLVFNLGQLLANKRTSFSCLDLLQVAF